MRLPNEVFKSPSEDVRHRSPNRKTPNATKNKFCLEATYNPNCHRHFRKPDRPGHNSCMGIANDPCNNLLVSRHKVQQFTKKSVADPTAAMR
jgi:hypothetical protein